MIPNKITEDEELLKVLNKLEKCLDDHSSDFDDVIWNGDLNWHINRDSHFSLILKRFISKLGLISIWDKFDCDYTHIHTDLKSISTIDHFLVNERLDLQHIEFAGPIHLGDNLSRHEPILLKLNVGNIKPRTETNIARPKAPMWYKANQEQLDNYTMRFHDKLQHLKVPHSLHCQSVHCDQNNDHSEETEFRKNLNLPANQILPKKPS